MTLVIAIATASAAPAVRPIVGAQVGASLGLAPPAVSALPRLELGLGLPWMEGMFRVELLAAWTRPRYDGTGNDARVPDGTWAWDAQQTEAMLALGPAVRFPMLSEKVVPELTVAPQLYWMRTRVNGSAGGAVFPEATETMIRMGVTAAAGAAMGLGPGEMNVQLAFSTSKIDGTISGDSSTAALAPMVGYRMVLGGDAASR